MAIVKAETSPNKLSENAELLSLWMGGELESHDEYEEVEDLLDLTPSPELMASAQAFDSAAEKFLKDELGEAGALFFAANGPYLIYQTLDNADEEETLVGGSWDDLAAEHDVDLEDLADRLDEDEAVGSAQIAMAEALADAALAALEEASGFLDDEDKDVSAKFKRISARVTAIRASRKANRVAAVCKNKKAKASCSCSKGVEIKGKKACGCKAAKMKGKKSGVKAAVSADEEKGLKDAAMAAIGKAFKNPEVMRLINDVFYPEDKFNETGLVEDLASIHSIALVDGKLQVTLGVGNEKMVVSA